MHVNGDANCYLLAYAVLKALLPSLSRDDVCNVRRVHPRSKGVAFSPLPGPLDLYDELPFLSLIVRLTSADLVQRIMNAKRTFDYLTNSWKDTNFGLFSTISFISLLKIAIFGPQITCIF